MNASLPATYAAGGPDRTDHPRRREAAHANQARAFVAVHALPMLKLAASAERSVSPLVSFHLNSFSRLWPPQGQQVARRSDDVRFQAARGYPER
jgi:hypothetical protein